MLDCFNPMLGHICLKLCSYLTQCWVKASRVSFYFQVGNKLATDLHNRKKNYMKFQNIFICENNLKLVWNTGWTIRRTFMKNYVKVWSRFYELILISEQIICALQRVFCTPLPLSLMQNTTSWDPAKTITATLQQRCV